MNDHERAWRDAVAATVFLLVMCILCSGAVFGVIMAIVQLSSD